MSFSVKQKNNKTLVKKLRGIKNKLKNMQLT